MDSEKRSLPYRIRGWIDAHEDFLILLLCFTHAAVFAAVAVVRTLKTFGLL